jgi:formylglycine-generating enzyme required for sulfatase activity
MGLAAVILLGAGLAAGAAVAKTKGAGKAFQDCAECPEMVVIPAGEFQMGAPPDEAKRDVDEAQHRVSFAKPFAVARYQVTWDQWESCARDGACDAQAVESALQGEGKVKPAEDFKDLGRGRHPVVGVSWYDAQRFAGWLNAKTGTNRYRLLSESEFEYAARAGTATAFPWGDKATHEQANYGKDDDEGLGGKAEGRDVWADRTAPVGSFPPNGFGLYDMHGNTYEWVEDCYEKDATLLPTDGSAMKGGNCAVRVMRSTSFLSNPHTLRSANRVGQYTPHGRGRNFIGFRVAKTLNRGG